MCYIWKNPTDPKEEVTLETLATVPAGKALMEARGMDHVAMMKHHTT